MTGYVAQKLGRVHLLTTHSSTERAHVMDIRSSWSVAGAIEEQVQKEDMVRWARTPDAAVLPGSIPTRRVRGTLLGALLP